MLKHSFKTAGIPRTGLEYQDLIGIELLIKFYRDPSLYHWVELESEDSNVGSLDDVVAARSDGTFELIQVKFTVDPDKYFLDWAWLLDKKPKGTSLLTKWANSLNKVADIGAVHSAKLRTNRRPDIEFNKALKGSFIDFDLVDRERRRVIETELGGSTNANAFFTRFEFSHSEPLFDDLEIQLKRLVIPTDTDTGGWLLLRDQSRRWATKKLDPEPDGRIRYQHLKQIITKKRARPIPQNFQIPHSYCAPNNQFHSTFITRLRSADSPVSVLWGTPGRGKSTYLSFIIDELNKEEQPVIRHHYFLSLYDTTSDRVSFSDIASSLMDQMIAHYPKAVQALEENNNELRKWIEACGKYFAKERKRFLVVVDGLDHVWREQGNISQMDHLFNHLLPCPENVTLIVGTQRVPDNQLPYRLIQNVGIDDWIEIPPMAEEVVHKWIADQFQAGRVRLRDKTFKVESQQLGEISSAFFQISQGHPLHLIYSFEALVRRGTFFTTEEIFLLPTCPEGDIRKYYNGLWGRLSTSAKQILHLIAGSDFHWPSDGIRKCIGPIDDIDHLLEHRRTGLIPFHGSILAYAREQPENEASFSSLLPKIVEWLERDATEYWRWGWLWLMKAKKGDCTELLTGTTRDWVIESLKQGWSDKQIVAILTEAEFKAFEGQDYCRTIELRFLKTRVQNGPEFQTTRFPEFQEAGIIFHKNSQQILNMADKIVSLSDEQIVSLTRTLDKDAFSDIVTECVEELRRRVNLWLSLRHNSNNDFISLTRCFLEVLALSSNIDIKKIIRFIDGFHDSDKMFEWFLNYLIQERRFDVLEAIASRSISSQKFKWNLLCQNAMVRVASEEGIDMTTRFRHSWSSITPLMTCWFFYCGHECASPVISPPISANIARDSYEYGQNNDLEEFFHTVFFSALAAALSAADEFSFILTGLDNRKFGWMKEAVNILEDTALQIAKGNAPLSFSTPFQSADKIDPVIGGNQNETSFAQYRAFKHALYQIAIDLHCLKNAKAKTSLVGIDELTALRSSAHWSDDTWINDDVERQLLLLDTEAVGEMLKLAIEAESTKVTVFNERADRWIELSRFSLMYEIADSLMLIKRAADCIIGYGFRKDLWATDILDSIVEIHDHDAADVMPWIRSLLPIVEQITEFTDGDETDHIRSELINVVATVCPDHIPELYAHYITQGELRYAEEALSAYCKLIDFSSPVSVALTRTFLDRQEVAVLHELCEKGDVDAGRVEIDQTRFLGGIPLQLKRETTDNDESIKSGTPPDITQFSPSNFSALVDHGLGNIGYEHKREALKRWLTHWKNNDKGLEALKSIRLYFAEEENPYSAETILDDAFLVSLNIEGQTAAYEWLVMAHIHRNGWSSHWTAEKEILRRLEWAAKYYKAKWAEFIYDTSKPSRYWQRRKYSFSIGTEYLVHFLLLVGQKELAARYTESLVRIVIAEVSDQPIPECKWFS